MIAYGIGLFFIIAGLMMWPFGLGSIIVGVIICLARFFTKYKSTSNYLWSRTFENSSVVKEFTDYINNHQVLCISITSQYIEMDDYKVYFESKGISNISIQNCEVLAKTIKNKIINGDKYEIESIRKYLNSSVGHDRPIGLIQTYNGNFSFDYGDRGPSYEITGYRLKYKEKVKKEKVKKSKISEWR